MWSWNLVNCHHINMSTCQHVNMSTGHLVIMSPCHLQFEAYTPWIILKSCSFEILSAWHHVLSFYMILSLCPSVLMSSCPCPHDIYVFKQTFRPSDHQCWWHNQMEKAPWKADTLCPKRSLFTDLGTLSGADQQVFKGRIIFFSKLLTQF